MTDEQIIREQQKAIKALEKRVTQLKERLVAKMKYEESFLLGTGVDLNFLTKLQQKDRKALEGL
jgi:hypothetical protein